MRCCSPCKADRSWRQATRKQTSPLGQVAEAEQTVGPVVFLASPVTIHLNGAAPKAHRGLKALVRARRAPVTAIGKIYEPISGRSGHRRTHWHRPRYRHQVWPCVARAGSWRLLGDVGGGDSRV